MKKRFSFDKAKTAKDGQGGENVQWVRQAFGWGEIIRDTLSYSGRLDQISSQELEIEVSDLANIQPEIGWRIGIGGDYFLIRSIKKIDLDRARIGAKLER